MWKLEKTPLNLGLKGKKKKGIREDIIFLPNHLEEEEELYYGPKTKGQNGKWDWLSCPRFYKRPMKLPPNSE